MKRDLHNDYFESFLKQNAEQLYMRPSAKVWGGISKKLNKRRRWMGFGLSTLLVAAGLLTYTTTADHNTPDKTNSTTKTSSTSITNGVSNNISNRTTTPSATSAAAKETATRTLLPSPSTASAILPVSGPIRNDNRVLDNQTTFNTEIWLTPVIPMAGAGLLHKLYKNNWSPVSNPELPVAIADKATAIKKQAKKHRFSMQLAFTPTISYRKLSDNKSINNPSAVANANAPFSFRPSAYDINNAVTHKPNMGLEVGLVTKYALSKNLKLRSGVQFNMNRYEVKAYNYVPELTTISLNNQNRPDSVNALSSYRNYNNNGNDWLQNLYLQVSVPVGLEVNLHSDDKFQFGIAGTLQPTYVFGDRVYLLSTDYKHYAQIPWLVRRWNVNTSFETFIAYSSGHIKWQVGPQVRYQLLSSFSNKYPVKENLFDFGLKVGVSLNK